MMNATPKRNKTYKRSKPPAALAKVSRKRYIASDSGPGRTKLYKSLSPFPEVRQATFTYCDIVSMSVSSGAGQYIFCANGLYDPDVTGTGHQPYFFDQLMAVYNHYFVKSAHIEVQPMFSQDITSPSDYVLTLFTEDDASPNATFTTNMEKLGAVSQVYNNTVALPPIISTGWKVDASFGYKNKAYTNLIGTATANPTENTMFVIKVSDNSLQSYTRPLLVKITYYAQLSEVRGLNGS